MSGFTNQKARDAVAFEPLPVRSWLNLTDEHIVISVNYSEKLSAILRSIAGAQWSPSLKSWSYPYTSADKIRDVFQTIDSLAMSAKENADTENIRRLAEKNNRETVKNAARIEREKQALAARPRSMSPKYMTARNEPKFTLSIEAIGDHLTTQSFVRMPPRNWVGQIVGQSANGKWARVYLNGVRDYRTSNSVGSRGIVVNYLLDPGLIYEVAQPMTWKSTARFFARIEDSKIIKMTEEEVRECLEK